MHIRILDDILEDYKEFMQISHGEALSEMKNCLEEAKIKWLNNRPANFIDANMFYTRAAHVPAMCTSWTLREPTLRVWSEMLIENYGLLNWRSVLDYGAGVCSHPLAMADAGCSGIVASDFYGPAFSFAQWRAWKYSLDVEFQYFHPKLDVQPIFSNCDCIICLHVIGHSWNPYGLLSQVLSRGKYVLWCDDFRTTEDPLDNIYPMHRIKPSGWDEIFYGSLTRIDRWLFESNVYGMEASQLECKWIEQSGWSRDLND